MTRGILQLILVCIVLPSQLLFGLADAEDSDEYISDLSPSPSRKSVEDSTVSRQVCEAIPQSGASATPDSATAQYLLGVIEYNEGNVELAKVWFQRAYESLEAEEDYRNRTFRTFTAQTLTFGRALSDKSAPPATPAKVQFPEGYKVNIYYRDGWYIQPKNTSVGKKQVYSFLPGSTYKIRVEAENEQSGRKRVNIGMKVIAALVMISWLMSR